ncbi:MAG TPA: protein kinase [Chloroflexota bacterium]|nr:protein kinase [Chloroflexota bacterium]
MTRAARRVIDGRYEQRERIGAGGMSEVWLATDRRLGRPVAVKLLSPALADDPAFLERFRREARVLATLRHPNVVQVYDRGRVDGTEFLVMEYVPGSNLTERLRERGRLDEDDGLRLVGQAAPRPRWLCRSFRPRPRRSCVGRWRKRRASATRAPPSWARRSYAPGWR